MSCFGVGGAIAIADIVLWVERLRPKKAAARAHGPTSPDGDGPDGDVLMRGWIAALALAGVAALVAAEGCYGPSPEDGSFKCTPDLGGVCPAGLQCSAQGFCVRNAGADGGSAPLDLAGDQASPPQMRTCDDRVMAGAFSNLTALTAANTSADEGHIALDPTGTARGWCSSAATSSSPRRSRRVTPSRSARRRP